MPPQVGMATTDTATISAEELQAELELPVEEEVVEEPPVADVAHFEVPQDAKAEVLADVDKVAAPVLYYHHNNGDLLENCIASHQELLDAWGGFNYHCPVPLEYTGITSVERQLMETQLERLQASARNLEWSKDNSVFIPNLRVFTSLGTQLTDRAERIF